MAKGRTQCAGIAGHDCGNQTMGTIEKSDAPEERRPDPPGVHCHGRKLGRTAAMARAVNSVQNFTWGCGHVGNGACARCFDRKADIERAAGELRKNATPKTMSIDGTEVISWTVPDDFMVGLAAALDFKP